ncbi:MAG: hypothetical protein QJR02_10135 [Sinobacteraceae bacterium]|nr:hypothetical protein [Nevskiaceae bacterium]
MIDGVRINLGGRDYVAPPLNFGALKRLQPELEQLARLSGPLTAQQIDAVCKIVHAALLRNYPELDLATVEDGLDLGNMAAVIEAVMAHSGLRRVEGQRSGEAQSPSTGTGFTAP